MVEEFVSEIIGLARSNENGTMSFSDESLRRLEVRFQEILKGPVNPEAVNAYKRTVAALHRGGQSQAAQQLLGLGAEVLVKLQAETRRLQTSRAT